MCSGGHLFLPSVVEAVGGAFGRLSLGSTARVIVVLPSATLMPVSRSRSASRAPSQGKRSRDLEAGSRTIRVSLLSSWFVSVVRVCARLIDSPLIPGPGFFGEGLLPSLLGFSSVTLSHNFQAFVDPCFQVPPVSSVFFPLAMTSFTGFGPRL